MIANRSSRVLAVCLATILVAAGVTVALRLRNSALPEHAAAKLSVEMPVEPPPEPFVEPAVLFPRAEQTPLSPAELEASIAAGREQFTRVRHADAAVDPNLAAHRRFNARSCAECHRQGGVGGAGPNENNVQLLSVDALREKPQIRTRLDTSLGAAVLHRASTSAEYDSWRAALLKMLAPKPRQIDSNLFVFGVTSDTDFGEPDAMSLPTKMARRSRILSSRGPIEERNTPPLFGLGRLAEIPQNAIDDVAANQHEDVRGRSPRIPGGYGRFGWKAGSATLIAFNENACAVELGLTTPGFIPATFRKAEPAEGGSANGLEAIVGRGRATVLPSRPPAGGIAAGGAFDDRLGSIVRAGPPSVPDMSAADVAALTRYVESLPAPRQVIERGNEAIVASGARVFEKTGCAVCHVPNLGGVAGVYSDLLLHAVGTAGGGFYGGSSPSGPGGGPDFDVARADEFRTPPLWGLADSAPYLHDGSATTLEEAILAHRVQGADSVRNFVNGATPAEQEALLAFLESLRAP